MPLFIVGLLKLVEVDDRERARSVARAAKACAERVGGPVQGELGHVQEEARDALRALDEHREPAVRALEAAHLGVLEDRPDLEQELEDVHLGGLSAALKLVERPAAGREDPPEPPQVGGDPGPGGTFGSGLTMQHNVQVVGSLSFPGQDIFVVDGARANHFLQTLRLSAVVPVHRKIGIGAAAEYFDRRTWFQAKSKPNQYFHYPQFRMFLTWRIS